jgi:hypothetical protein
MRISKAGREIRSLEEWFDCAPPKMGACHWKDGRSAKELARSGLREEHPSPPQELRELLERTFGAGIAFLEAKPECVIRLDELPGEHRNCDFVVLCKVQGEDIVINVEAKADEPWDDPGEDVLC